MFLTQWTVSNTIAIYRDAYTCLIICTRSIKVGKMVNMIIMLLEFKETWLRIDQLLPFHFLWKPECNIIT
jgi:hypothetical protein